MIAPEDVRYIRWYTTQQAWDERYGHRVHPDLAKKVLELGEGSVWRYQPPASQMVDWGPDDYWVYAVGPKTLTRKDIEDALAEEYGGDWSPHRVKWSIERTDRVGNPDDDDDDDEREGDLRYANLGTRQFYIELSCQSARWFWVVGEEGRSKWIASGEDAGSAALAQALANIALNRWVREHGIHDRVIVTVIDDCPATTATRLKAAL